MYQRYALSGISTVRPTKPFLHHVQVRVAHARATDFYQHPAGAGRRLGNINDVSGLADANKPHCSHD
jgi:hypothetical protein